MAEFAKYNALHGGLKKLFFWRSRGGSEVDLVITENEKITAFEVKWQGGKSNKAAFGKEYKAAVEIINKRDPFIGYRFEK